MQRPLLIAFLIIPLAACQTAPAGTPTLSLSPTPALTEVPRAAATSTQAVIATQINIPTPTISPDILKEQASPLCEKSFSALFEKGPLIPPFAILKKETYTEAPAWDVSHPLPHMGSLSSAEVQTVFCISESRTQAGTYADGSAAHQFFWEVRAVALPTGRLIARNSFTGSPPPKTKTSGSGAGDGSFPYKEFAAWVFNQVDHPDFLYFNDAITSLALSPAGNVAAFGTAIAGHRPLGREDRTVVGTVSVAALVAAGLFALFPAVLGWTLAILLGWLGLVTGVRAFLEARKARLEGEGDE